MSLDTSEPTSRVLARGHGEGRDDGRARRGRRSASTHAGTRRSDPRRPCVTTWRPSAIEHRRQGAWRHVPKAERRRRMPRWPRSGGCGALRAQRWRSGRRFSGGTVKSDQAPDLNRLRSTRLASSADRPAPETRHHSRAQLMPLRTAEMTARMECVYAIV